MTNFRCSVASSARGEAAVGTASTVRAFLLVEFPGAWGLDALIDSRLPADVKDHLRHQSRRYGIKTLLIRRHGRHTPDGIRIFAAVADPVSPAMETALLPHLSDLLALDLAPLGRGETLGLSPHPDPVFLTCTHGRHDMCCAELGRPIAAALSTSHPELCWEVSHIGGDRFAANVLVLPDGLYYGRVTAADAGPLVERHLAGHLSLDLLRGRSAYPFAVQAAEWFLRKETGMTATGGPRLKSRESADSRWTVEFADAGDRRWRVRLTVARQPEQRLTCSALHRDAAPTYDLIDVTQVGDLPS